MKRLLTILIVLIVVSGCREINLPPPGSYSEVLLVTERGERDAWDERVRPLLEREHDYVTSVEMAFRVTSIQASVLEDSPRFKTLVLVGPMDDNTDVGSWIIDLIGANGVSRVLSGKATVFRKEDVPGHGQVTLIITAPDVEALEKTIAERGEEFADILEESCRKRLRKYLMTNRNTQVSDHLKRKYGFDLAVPAFYELYSEEANPPGIELMRNAPTRVLGIFWVDWHEPPSIYRPNELYDVRAKYVYERYKHDRMQRDRVRYTWTRIGEYSAIRMSGYWYNEDTPAGGYFETYFIYDKDTDLLWAVDLLTFAPGRDKHPLVRELHSLAETFRYQ